ncbi:MAG: hypothetical protein Fur0044_28830 [Anaerolineae bacterium]|nr:hypothetical protein [Anaerolineales bacterium]MCQ3977847.1 hypothetical protein [Anaerolineae bacterium]
MRITITPATAHVSIPLELKGQAPLLLQDIWRDEFAQQSHLILEMTQAVRNFIEKAKLNPTILVYR